MKKLLCIATVAFLAASTIHAEDGLMKANAEPGNIGVGFQGLILGNLISGVAVRGTPAPIGWQAEMFQGSIDIDGGGDADMLVLRGKGYYALVERQNSTLYVGGSIGYWMGESSGNDFDGFSIAPLFGVEWNFTELPELGFNFEVAYEIANIDSDGGDATINGVNVTTGVVYYY